MIGGRWPRTRSAETSKVAAVAKSRGCADDGAAVARTTADWWLVLLACWTDAHRIKANGSCAGDLSDDSTSRLTSPQIQMRHLYIKKPLHGPVNTRTTRESAVDPTEVTVRHEEQVRTDQGGPPCPGSFKLQRLTRIKRQLSIRHALRFSQSLAASDS